MSVAGPCVMCGGRQRWTIIRGEVYTSCDNGCQPLPLEGIVPPPGSDGGADLERVLRRAAEGGYVAHEGRETDTGQKVQDEGLPF